MYSREGNPSERLALKYPGPLSPSPGGRGLEGKVSLQTNSQRSTSSGGFQEESRLLWPAPNLTSMHPGSPKLTSSLEGPEQVHSPLTRGASVRFCSKSPLLPLPMLPWFYGEDPGPLQPARPVEGYAGLWSPGSNQSHTLSHPCVNNKALISPFCLRSNLGAFSLEQILKTAK